MMYELSIYGLLYFSGSPALVGDNTQQGLRAGRPTRAKRKVCMLIAYILCVFGFTKAQTLFSKNYDEGRPVLLFSSVETVNNKFYVIGTSGENGVLSNYDRIFYGIIDANGIMIQHIDIYDSVPKGYSAYLNALTKDSIGNLFYTGYSFDSTAKANFVKINTATDDIVLKEYYTPNTYAFYGSKVLYVGYDCFITGVRTDLTINSADNILIKIDTNGNRLWQKQYGANNRLEYARSLVNLQNRNLMIGSFRSDFNQTNEKANTWLLEVDTGGNVVRQWFDPSDSTYVAEGLRQTQDGGFIYGAQKRVYQVAGSLGFTATVVKMDSNFNKQWVYEGGVLGTYTGVVDIEPLPDGGYVACGNYSNKEAWVIKFTETGQVVWLRKYMGLTDTTATWNLLSDIDILPDGGFIAVGQCQRIVNPNNLTPQVGWFLKLDSNGCEVENCLVGINDPQPYKDDFSSQIQIQPNPASDKVWVEAEPGMLGGELKIYDVSGRLVKQLMVEALQFGLEVSELSKGVYVISIEHEGLLGRGKLVKE